jgi:catechol 2,3-dioxygenase-like lactoylglutathione lyase family enzyme
MTLRLDHANLLVRDIDATIGFLRTALPALRVRGSGGSGAGRWVHLGADDLYVALEQATAEPAERWMPYEGKPGTNHLGIEVDDVEAVRARLRDAGYRDTTYPNAHPHRSRVYFRDREGNDWEFVEYRSSVPSQRHDYGYGVVDEALDRISSFGPDLRNGMTSHAPMTIEALAALGRPEAVMPWLDQYVPDLLPAPPARERIDPGAWESALSSDARFSDWSAWFREELENERWQHVLARWVERLAPGLCAAALHGVLRVGHATRSLGIVETPQRLRELADALATWASTYQRLPTRLPPALGSVPEAFPPRHAIERIEVVPPERRRFSGTIVSSLAALDEWPAFAPVIGLLDVTGDLRHCPTALAETFARVYLANASDPLSAIVFVHGVTGPAAVAHLLPHLEPEPARRVLRYAWQASAGLYAAFGTHRPGAFEPTSEGWDTLIDRAVDHGDEHAIKFTEACRTMDLRAPSPAYAAAVSHALVMLPRA